ncbi:glutathione synthetase ATP-binding domain-like protein [Rozella allomycis CSF55]|uniref:Glutathione synthetase ATP-binding domain-like protein n=1 Tax=Rozella allomycis (strain CSF55) TaxID=988480 RepID=A0A4P9YM91_ROZAC|nr:glutathione synthetase ATP-binding domain-like protein [Rozella allomycis CSF55]
MLSSLPSIHILVGCPTEELLETSKDEILLSNEYGKNEGVSEIVKVLHSLGYSSIQIHSVTLNNYNQIFQKLGQQSNFVVLNLCDGTETDGYPGISIVTYLEQKGWPYTGANPYFFDITNSKPIMKKILMENKVSTSPFVEIDNLEEAKTKISKLENTISYPMFIKPSISYASICISDNSVVTNQCEALGQLEQVLSQTNGGVFIEKFLEGREFTALVSGDATQGIVVYDVAERVFNKNLKANQRILAFDRYWAGYDLNGNAPDEKERLYTYEPASPLLMDRLKELAKNAYLSLKGNGYGRVDIRSDSMDYSTMKLYVLEILRLSKVSPSDFMDSLIHFAMKRAKK